MECEFRGPEHPHGPHMGTKYALVKETEGGLVTCGKVSFASPPTFELWPEEVKARFVDLVTALEEHFVAESGVFETEEDFIHVSIPAGPGEPGSPEEF